MHIASAASSAKTKPKVSINPKALYLANVFYLPSIYKSISCTETISPTSLIGRGITLCAVNLPIAAAALAPASTDAFTAATSPFTIIVTRVEPIFSYEINSTLAALSILSAASSAGTNPIVSTRPKASSP
ncbi:hypothetical protein CTC_01450 [Clostridium tetani E88]|uniref:Uncharacterized protein n=1 Tax=Clostridium tetani (strain Massachusetts / E88) TaxID=212717 RepID=Q894T4_CLOTE|nr:hypothetical protein CTC_01450 [Clostridium tetani E88]